MLFDMTEIQDVLSLLNRAPMSRIEQRFVQGFFERLVSFCSPPKPAEDTMAIADAIDKIDEE